MGVETLLAISSFIFGELPDLSATSWLRADNSLFFHNLLGSYNQVICVQQPSEVFDLTPTSPTPNHPVKLEFASWVRWVRFLILHLFSPERQVRLVRYGGENVNFVDAFVVIFVSRVE
ncbi:MAG TPA: hypothetical protein VMT20_21995 [Terriglobia bacterium]|nr:hypothetical protein [Terriglobia bacterium]